MTNCHVPFYYKDAKPYKFHCACGFESESSATIAEAIRNWESKVKEYIKE